MGIKTIPLSRLEADPRGTLRECADSGEAFVVELPDHRLVAIQDALQLQTYRNGVGGTRPLQLIQKP